MTTKMVDSYVNNTRLSHKSSAFSKRKNGRIELQLVPGGKQLGGRCHVGHLKLKNQSTSSRMKSYEIDKSHQKSSTKHTKTQVLISFDAIVTSVNVSNVTQKLVQALAAFCSHSPADLPHSVASAWNEALFGGG